MNMRIDHYTGEAYDADRWYRGANGIWHDRDAERRHAELCAKAEAERRAKRNANRAARGLRKKSASEFQRASDRYQEWIAEDSEERFGDFLKRRYGRRWLA